MTAFADRLTPAARGAAWRGIWAALALGLLAAQPARADVRIDITRGTVQPMPIALPNLSGDNATENQIGSEITQVVTADLDHSGLFKPIDPHAFIQDAASLRVAPRFNDWKVLNVQALVTGQVQVRPDGQIRVEYRLWDVFAGTQMNGMAYTTVPNNWRRIAHKIADDIYSRITGESGYFDSRIVYIAESGPAKKRVKRLGIMDQDGANNRFLTDGSVLVLTPRFSPSAQQITYLAYYNNNPRVYLFDIDTGRQEVLGDFPGMTFAPRFSPDGNKVVMSLSKGGVTNIYTMDLRTRRVTQLTASQAIDTAPCYSPDGSKIVFESDRGGNPQLYVMNADGSNVQRISFGPGRYDAPVWSPRGDLIAFTKIAGGAFTLGVMHPDGTGERQLVQAYDVEGASWAPNGRVLVYFKSNGGNSASHLYTIDVTGFNERELVTPTDASDPAWGPENHD